MRSINVLIVEEFQYIADLNVLELKRGGFTVHSRYVSNGVSMREASEEQEWDIILSDNATSHFNAMQALAVRNRLRQKTSSIIVSEDIAPESIRYVVKSHCCAHLLKEDLYQLVILVRKILESQSGTRQQIKSFVTTAATNRKQNTFERELTVQELLEKVHVELQEYVTAQVNDEIPKKENFDSTTIRNDDRVELLYYIGGGR